MVVRQGGVYNAYHGDPSRELDKADAHQGYGIGTAGQSTSTANRRAVARAGSAGAQRDLEKATSQPAGKLRREQRVGTALAARGAGDFSADADDTDGVPARQHDRWSGHAATDVVLGLADPECSSQAGHATAEPASVKGEHPRLVLGGEGQAAERQRVERLDEFVIGLHFVIVFLIVDRAERGQISDRIDEQPYDGDMRLSAQRAEQPRMIPMGLAGGGTAGGADAEQRLMLAPT